jgi:hypothetical protein
LDPVKRPWLQLYIYDILIFSSNPDEHLAHIKEVVAILAANNLYVRSGGIKPYIKKDKGGYR